MRLKTWKHEISLLKCSILYVSAYIGIISTCSDPPVLVPKPCIWGFNPRSTVLFVHFYFLGYILRKIKIRLTKNGQKSCFLVNFRVFSWFLMFLCHTFSLPCANNKFLIKINENIKISLFLIKKYEKWHKFDIFVYICAHLCTLSLHIFYSPYISKF